MPAWTSTLLAVAVALLVLVPATASAAFAAGWFERSSETRRARRLRRPSHGGLLVAIALLVVGVAADLDAATTRAVVAVAVLSVLAGHRAQRGHGPAWLPPAGWVAVALAVPLCGVRAQLTGTTALDVAFTAIAVLALVAGVDAIDHSDVAAPAVVGVAAAGMLAVAVDSHDSVAVLAGALVGACVGLVGHAWPPASVRVGAIGPMVLGGSLAIVAVAVHPSVGAPRSALVPLHGLGLLAAVGRRPGIDRRLAARWRAAHVVLPLAAAAGALGAGALGAGALGVVPCALIALVPLGLVLWAGRRDPRPAAAVPSPARRWVARAVIPGAIVGVVVVVAVAGLLLLSARRSMERGKVAALAGLDAAKAGHVDAAQAHFATADRELSRAHRTLDDPVLRLGDLVPIVAPNLRAARALASAGSDLSAAAVAVAQRSGAESLRLVDGRFPVEQSRAIGDQLAGAVTTMQRAQHRIDAARSPYLLGPIAHAGQQVRDRVAAVDKSVRVAAEATRLLPRLLGGDASQRWIVAVMSTSELRGAGGLLGDFAELRLSGGRVDLVRTISAAQMNRATHPDAQAAALPSVYAQQYGGYKPDQLWQNLSVTPDLVTMSRAIAAAYPHTDGGGPVQGVLTIDPLGLQGLLRVTGPVRVPDWPTPISAQDVSDVLLFQQYDRLVGPQLERFQGEVVAAVVRALTGGRPISAPALVAAMAPTLPGGHLRLWSADPEGERLIADVGADGALRPPVGSDFIQLVTQNGSEAKIDWYLDRTLAYDATFDPPSGHLTATATVTLTNHAPASGVASDVIGEAGGPTLPGQSRTVITVLSPHLVTGATDESGNSLPVTLAQEDGLYSGSVLVLIPPGGTAVVHFALVGYASPGTTYHLEVGHQPTRVPDQTDVSVHGVQGWVLTGPGAAEHRTDGPERLSFTFAPR